VFKSTYSIRVITGMTTSYGPGTRAGSSPHAAPAQAGRSAPARLRGRAVDELEREAGIVRAGLVMWRCMALRRPQRADAIYQANGTSRRHHNGGVRGVRDWR